MKIKILGCGNAFSKLNYNQCFMLTENCKNMLIDFGSKAPMALDNAGVNIFDIDAVYISHQHGDHVGGLEEMAFTRYDWMNRPEHWKEAPNEYAPKLFAQKELMKNLWKKSLSGGLESMEGFDATLETFFEAKPVTKSFTWEGWNFELIQQVHIMTGSMISNTFGLLMTKDKHKTVYFTTDSQFNSPHQVQVFYKKADIIFQDCECLPFKSGVHANYMELAGYPEANATVYHKELRAKMWLSHYQDFVTQGKGFDGKPCDWHKKAKDDGFKGFVKVGQTMEV